MMPTGCWHNLNCDRSGAGMNARSPEWGTSPAARRPAHLRLED